MCCAVHVSPREKVNKTTYTHTHRQTHTHLLHQLAHHRADGIKHIQISRRPHIALVRGERENGHSKMLILVLLPGEGGPLEASLGEELHTIGKGHRAAGGTFTARVDDGFDGACSYVCGWVGEYMCV